MTTSQLHLQSEHNTIVYLHGSITLLVHFKIQKCGRGVYLKGTFWSRPTKRVLYTQSSYWKGDNYTDFTDHETSNQHTTIWPLHRKNKCIIIRIYASGHSWYLSVQVKIYIYILSPALQKHPSTHPLGWPICIAFLVLCRQSWVSEINVLTKLTLVSRTPPVWSWLLWTLGSTATAGDNSDTHQWVSGCHM